MKALTRSTKARDTTIYQVAEQAGVSIATVSRVLRGTAPTSPTTRRKVLQAVQELEYIPLRAARKVDVPRHQTHGLVLPGLNGPYYSELLTGFEAAAARSRTRSSTASSARSIELFSITGTSWRRARSTM